jgi:hypothetical protein
VLLQQECLEARVRLKALAVRLALPFALRNLLGRLEIPGSIAVLQTASEPLGCDPAEIFSAPGRRDRTVDRSWYVPYLT